METLKRHLIQVEQAERIGTQTYKRAQTQTVDLFSYKRLSFTGSWTVACEQRLLLGQYFSAPEDLWLRLHFYQSCVSREHGHRSRPVTEARLCLAELYLQRGGRHTHTPHSLT